MKVNSVVFILVCTLAAQTLAQSPDITAIDQLTAKAIKHLTTNTRYTCSSKSYTDLQFGKLFGHKDVRGWFGETQGLVHSTDVTYDPKSESKFGVWVNGDQFVITKPGEKGGTVIHRQHAAWGKDSDAAAFADFPGHMGLGHFFLGTSARKYGLARNPDSFPVPDRYDPAATVITQDTYGGRACYKVVITPDAKQSRVKPAVHEYLLDKEHGMVLARRQKGTYHVPKGTTTMKLLDVDQVTEVSYGPPQADTGLPFPTAVKGWFVWPTGRREPMTDVEFTEFRRYTPTADELDFEKQFGIPLPALPPKPAGSATAAGGRTKWWLLGGLAVVGLAAAVVVVRRRRAAT